MTPETEKALRDSIDKWKRNARVRKMENYLTDSDDCPLCHLFHHFDRCKSCPVSAATGEPYCRDTPYDFAHDMWVLWRDDPTNPELAQAARDAAREEVRFLESLLPEASQ